MGFPDMHALPRLLQGSDQAINQASLFVHSHQMLSPILQNYLTSINVICVNRALIGGLDTDEDASATGDETRSVTALTNDD